MRKPFDQEIVGIYRTWGRKESDTMRACTELIGN